MDTSDDRGLRRLLPRLAAALLVLAVLVLAVTALRRWLGEPVAPARQVARIALLPDTPPPPPPPPPKERKEEPPKPDKAPLPTPDSPVKPPPQAPVSESLKMEGAAGNGPSAFAAGAVSQDYRGGAPVIGPAASAGRGIDRAQERLYAGSVRQALRDELERQLPPESGELSAAFALWIGADGRLSRWELEGEGAAGEQAQALRQALGRSAEHLTLPAPGAVSQPLRFRLTLRNGA